MVHPKLTMDWVFCHLVSQQTAIEPLAPALQPSGGWHYPLAPILQMAQMLKGCVGTMYQVRVSCCNGLFGLPDHKTTRVPMFPLSGEFPFGLLVIFEGTYADVLLQGTPNMDY